MTRRTWRRRCPVPALVLALTIALLAGVAFSHPQILFARVTTEPERPPAEESFRVRVTLSESSGREVTDLELALLIFEPGTDLVPASGDHPDGHTEAAPITTVDLVTTGEEGDYRGAVDGLPEGAYPFRLAELVDGEIESNAIDILPVGAEEVVELELLMPPATAGVGAWLVWLVGLPLLAGLLVTILVLTSKGKQTGA